MIRVVHPCIRIPDPDFLPIPDPGSRGQKGTGSLEYGLPTKKENLIEYFEMLMICLYLLLELKWWLPLFAVPIVWNNALGN